MGVPSHEKPVRQQEGTDILGCGYDVGEKRELLKDKRAARASRGLNIYS